MKKGDSVRVMKVHRDTMPNLWGTPIDLTYLINKTGKIEVSYTDGTYGIEFDDDHAHAIRQYTGVLFTEDSFEVIT